VSDLHACPERPDQVEPWFLFTGDHDREDGDGQVSEVDADGITFAFGDPNVIEDLIGVPRGTLR
jgi:hypothetical protein